MQMKAKKFSEVAAAVALVVGMSSLLVQNQPAVSDSASQAAVGEPHMVKASLGQDYFVVSRGESVNIPLTVQVGKSFDGRIGVGQSRDFDQFSAIHWASGGVYQRCRVAKPIKEPLKAGQSQAYDPLTITYTHRHGESRDHTMIVTVLKNAPKGVHRAFLTVIEGKTTHRLPIVFDII